MLQCFYALTHTHSHSPTLLPTTSYCKLIGCFSVSHLLSHLYANNNVDDIHIHACMLTYWNASNRTTFYSNAVPVTNVSVPVAVPCHAIFDICERIFSFSLFPFAIAYIYVHGTPAPILDADRANAFSSFHSIQFHVVFVSAYVSLSLFPLCACVCLCVYCYEFFNAHLSHWACVCVSMAMRRSIYVCIVFRIVHFSCVLCFLLLRPTACVWVHACVFAVSAVCTCLQCVRAPVWNSPSDEYKRRYKCVVGVIFDSTIDKQTALDIAKQLVQFIEFWSLRFIQINFRVV